MSKIFLFLGRAALCAVLLFLFVEAGSAQKPKAVKPSPPLRASQGPSVTQIDIEGLKELLQSRGKPFLINFWATWCDPCREEFPDLVKLNAEYEGRIEFITISLDDVEDIKTLVPKFLGEVKAKMPAYLLKTPDESAAISLVSRDWSGNLPLTVLYNEAGENVYTKAGKFNYETLKSEIAKVAAHIARSSSQ